MNIDGEGPDVTKSIPDRASHGKIDWLQFNSDAQAVKDMALRHIRHYRTQSSSDFLFVCNKLILQPR